MIIQKNILSNLELELIEKQLDSLPFYLTNDTVGNYQTPWMGHNIISRYDIEKEEPKILSPTYDFFYGVVKRFADTNNIKVNKICRMCLNLSFSNSTNQFFAAPHTDHEFPHNNLILYLTDSSGNTVLFDDQENIIHEEEPEKGKMIMFDGSIKHTMRPCKGDEKRLILVTTFI